MVELTRILYALAVGQCLLLAVYFILRRRREGVVRWPLTALLVAVAAQAAAAAMERSGWFSERLDTRLAGAFVFGPLIYFYVLDLRAPARITPLRLLAHFALPAAILALTPLLAPWPAPVSDWVYVSLFGYLALSLWEARRRERSDEASTSAFQAMARAWLTQVVLALTVVVAVDFLSFLADAMGAELIGRIEDCAVAGGLAAFAAFIVWRALDEPRLLLDPSKPAAKYHYSGLTEPDIAAICARVSACLERDKPHLDEDLTLARMADDLALTPRELSQAINAGFGQGFPEFVARHRIEAAMKMLADPSRADESILTIMLSVGFSSKSAFNRAFKFATGDTPSQYRRKASARVGVAQAG